MVSNLCVRNECEVVGSEVISDSCSIAINGSSFIGHDCVLLSCIILIPLLVKCWIWS